jgi:NAD(P)-dependent dehydrogenase (short-subunit alcohol dehydrogenase family)
MLFSKKNKRIWFYAGAIIAIFIVFYLLYRLYSYLFYSRATQNLIQNASIKPGSKTVMITGGSSGIGYAYSNALLTLGYKVVVVSKKTAKEKVKELQEKHPNLKDNIIGIIADVRNKKSMESAFKEASAFSPTGVLDVIILNAGINGEIFKDAENIIQTNLVGPIYGIELYVNQITNNLSRPADKDKGYQIIVTGSLASFVPVDMNLSPAYDASKAGIGQYVRGIRPFADRYNFRINAVCPAGMVYTNLTAPFIDTPEKKAGAYLYQNSEGRGGIMTPEQIVPGMLEVLTNKTYNGDLLAVQPNLGFIHRIEHRDENKAYIEYGKYDERDSYATKKFIDYAIFSKYMKNVNNNQN